MSNPVSYEPSRPSGQYKNENVKKMQSEVDGVVDIMRSNVQKIVERGEKLEELDDRAHNLSESANEFQKTAKKVKKKFWWQNLKMTIILAAVIILIIIIIIVSTVGFPSSSNEIEVHHPSPDDLPKLNSTVHNLVRRSVAKTFK